MNTVRKMCIRRELFSRKLSPLYRVTKYNKVSYIFGSFNDISLNELYGFEKLWPFDYHRVDGRLVKRLNSYKSLAIENEKQIIKDYPDLLRCLFKDIMIQPSLYIRKPYRPPIGELVNKNQHLKHIVKLLIQYLGSARDIKYYGESDYKNLNSDLLHFLKDFPIRDITKFTHINDLSHTVLEKITGYMGMDYELMYLYRDRPIFQIYTDIDIKEDIKEDIIGGETDTHRMMYNLYNYSVIDYFSYSYSLGIYTEYEKLDTRTKYRSYKLMDSINKYHKGDEYYNDLDEILFVIRYDHLLALFDHIRGQSHKLEVYNIDMDDFVTIDRFKRF